MRSPRCRQLLTVLLLVMCLALSVSGSPAHRGDHRAGNKVDKGPVGKPHMFPNQHDAHHTRLPGQPDWMPPVPVDSHRKTVSYKSRPQKTRVPPVLKAPVPANDGHPHHPVPTDGGHPDRPHPIMNHQDGYRSIVYYVNWAPYDRKHFPWELPFDNLTHVLYSFASVSPTTGEIKMSDSYSDEAMRWPEQGDSEVDVGHNLYGCMKQFNKAKLNNRNLKIVLSVGGWSGSDSFAPASRTPELRRNFARSAVSIIRKYGFDGLDVDWEFPKDATEAANYVELLRVVREEMDSYAATLPKSTYGKDGNPYHFVLSVACPAGPQRKILNIPAMDKYLDFWNLMAYDYSGGFSKVAGHQANLYPSGEFSTAESLDYYQRFVPSQKMVMGMPLYGRSFEGTQGIGKPFKSVQSDFKKGPGNWEAGIYEYKVLPLPGAEVRHDPRAGATYSYDPATGVLVSYDTLGLARQKARYIKEHYLGGAMWWESAGDKKGEDSVIKNVVDELGGSHKTLMYEENLVEYPDSEWDNLREGKL